MNRLLQSSQPNSPSKSLQTLAATLRAPRTFDLEQVDLPEIDDKQVLVRLEGCGVCGSELPVWQGRDWFDYPRPVGAPGHEGWGVVEAVGAKVTNIQFGQRVACLSYRAYATHDVADAGHVVPLPDSLCDQCFPGEPLACAINVLRRCKVRAGDHVAIVGIGFLGALLTQLLRNIGVNVTAISRRSFALEIAEKSGATTLLAFDDPAVLGQHNDQFCCVIEATGNQQSLDLATRLVGYAGNLVIAGYHQDGDRHINMQQWNWKGIDVINAHQREPLDYVEGLREAVSAVESGSVKLDWLITHKFSLANINDAFDIAEHRPAGFLKSVVLFD